MPTPKPPYPAAFRQQMVELVRAGRGISDLAREFGCNASSIHAWMKAAGGFDGSGASGATSTDAPLSMNERQELIELRRKFKQVQMERDILAKATAWFAGKSEKTSMSSTNS
jgi:transposase